jgi:chromosomal replication initiation ATPase DnaA
VFNLPQVWQQVLSHIQKRATQALLEQKCRLSAFDGQIARISVSSSGVQPVLKQKQGDIEAAFHYIFGTSIRVAIDIAADAQMPSPTVDPRQPPSAAPASVTAAAASPFSVTAASAYSTPVSSIPTAIAAPPPVPTPTAVIASPPQPTPTVAPTSVAPPTSPPPPIPEPALTQSPATPAPPPAPHTTNTSTAPPIVSTSGRRWDEAEIANAAQQLASFFGGEVVTLDEDVLS